MRVKLETSINVKLVTVLERNHVIQVVQDGIHAHCLVVYQDLFSATANVPHKVVHRIQSLHVHHKMEQVR